MLRTSTLLIVIVLAGGPVGLLACDLWCTSPGADGHHSAVGCHHRTSQISFIDQQVTPAVGCHDAADITPFLTEARQSESTSPAAVPLTSFDREGLERNDDVAQGWRVLALQPPRPSSSRPVLRV